MWSYLVYCGFLGVGCFMVYMSHFGPVASIGQAVMMHYLLGALGVFVGIFLIDD